MSTAVTTNGHAKTETKRAARAVALPEPSTPDVTRIAGRAAALIRVEGDAAISASNASQIVAGHDMRVDNSAAMLMVANRDLHVEDAGAPVMAAGRDLALKNGGAALMAAGKNLTATNAGAGVLWAGHDLTVHNGGGAVQTARQTAAIEDQKAMLVAGRTIQATRSTVALAIGYDIQATEGSQVIVAVSLRSFVDALVGVACFVPVQMARRLKMRMQD